MVPGGEEFQRIKDSVGSFLAICSAIKRRLVIPFCDPE